jgi:hypothetical protein
LQTPSTSVPKTEEEERAIREWLARFAKLRERYKRDAIIEARMDRMMRKEMEEWGLKPTIP